MILQPDNLGVYQAPNVLPGAFCALTQAVFDDEPCLILMERNLLSEDCKVQYRYQILKVVRNDRPANAYVVLGPSSAFPQDEIDIPGSINEGNGKYLLLHTVAELRDIADHLRNEKPCLQFEAPPMQDKWLEQLDQKDRLKTRKTTSGYGGGLVRA